jgi:hypothetical protein
MLEAKTLIAALSYLKVKIGEYNVNRLLTFHPIFVSNLEQNESWQLEMELRELGLHVVRSDCHKETGKYTVMAHLT